MPEVTVIDSAARGWAVRPALTLIAVVLAWTVIAFLLLSPDTLYSADVGVKFVQARSLLLNGFRSMGFVYPGGPIEPSWHLFPFGKPFVFRTPDGIQAIFPTAVTLLNAPFVAAGGLSGMVLLSLAGGAAVLWYALKFGRGAWAPALPIVLGLGTPLWFYAAQPMEHAPAVACDLAATWLALSARRARGFFLAGLLLGAGGALRDESLLLFPGLLVLVCYQGGARIPGDAREGPRPVGRPFDARRFVAAGLLATGVLAVIGAMALVDVLAFGRPAAAHLRHAVHLLRSAFGAVSDPNPELPALAPMSFRERYDIVVHYWLVSSVTRLAVGVFLAAVAVAVAIARWARSAVGILLVATVVLAGAILQLWTLLPAPRWVPGLYGLSPFIVFALFPAPGVDPAIARQRRLVLLVVATYLALALLGVDTSGGKSLGPRLLLPIVPLIAVAAWQAIVAYWRQPDRGGKLAGAVGLALVAVAVVLQLTVMLRAYIDRNQDDDRALTWVAQSQERILVADDLFTAQMASSLYFRKVILLADRPEKVVTLDATLARARIPAVLVISRRSPPVLSLAPYRLVKSQTFGRMTVQRWQR